MGSSLKWADKFTEEGVDIIRMVEGKVYYKYTNEYCVDSMMTEDFIKKFKLVDKKNVTEEMEDENHKKHSHYFKDVRNYDFVDVYAICKIFGVDDSTGCIHHAIKKLLVAGGRGYKDRKTDLQNVVDTIERLIEIEYGEESQKDSKEGYYDR